MTPRTKFTNDFNNILVSVSFDDDTNSANEIKHLAWCHPPYPSGNPRGLTPRGSRGRRGPLVKHLTRERQSRRREASNGESGE